MISKEHALYGRARSAVAALLALCVLAANLAGCGASMAPPIATSTAGPPIPPITPTVPPAAAVEPTPEASASAATVLTWWTPEFASPKAGDPSGSQLAQYLTEFEALRGDGVRVAPVLKARYGKGGLLDFLRTAQAVAPAVLPDLVTLDTSELEQAATLGLLQPLDPLLDAETLNALYPFARQAGRFNGRLLAVPVLVDLSHLVYNRTSVPEPPLTWTDVLARRINYVFPAGNPQPPSANSPIESVQHAFVSQYLAAGGTVDPETRQLVVAEEPLLRVLSFYADARDTGILPAEVLEITHIEDAWARYTMNTQGIANVSARQYLSEGDSLQNTDFAALPGWEGTAVPVVRGWALAITATDPVRQQAAADLIGWLLAPQRNGRWAQAAGWLPVSPRAWITWGVNRYNTFLNEQLAGAVSAPAGLGYTQTSAQLQKAVIAVLRDRVSPAEATVAALAQASAR